VPSYEKSIELIQFLVAAFVIAIVVIQVIGCVEIYNITEAHR
jgi:hypothetical protein